MSTNLLSKVTTKNCNITSRQCEDLVAGGKSVDVLAVVAKVGDSKVISGDGEMRDSVQFSGQVLAKNMITGEEYRGRRMFLPAVAEDFVFSALQSAKTTDPGAVVTVRVMLTAEPHNSAKGGYKFKYGARPFDEPRADDLSELLTAMVRKQITGVKDKK